MALAQMIHREVSPEGNEEENRFGRRRRGAVRRGAVYEVSGF